MGFPRAPLVPEILQTAEQEFGPSFHHFCSELLVISLLPPLPNIINASSMPEKTSFPITESLKGKMGWSYSHFYGTSWPGGTHGSSGCAPSLVPFLGHFLTLPTSVLKSLSNPILPLGLCWFSLLYGSGETVHSLPGKILVTVWDQIRDPVFGRCCIRVRTTLTGALALPWTSSGSIRKFIMPNCAQL